MAKAAGAQPRGTSIGDNTAEAARTSWPVSQGSKGGLQLGVRNINLGPQVQEAVQRQGHHQAEDEQ